MLAKSFKTFPALCSVIAVRFIKINYCKKTYAQTSLGFVSTVDLTIGYVYYADQQTILIQSKTRSLGRY